MKKYFPVSLCACVLAFPTLLSAAQPVAAADAPAGMEKEVLLSKDALFDLADDKPAPKDVVAPAAPVGKEVLPESKEALFGDMPAAEAKGSAAKGVAPQPGPKDALFEPLVKPHVAKKADGGQRWSGFFQGEAAYTYADPAHWSKTMGRLELGTQGKLGQGVQWKLSGRIDYNPVFDLINHYQSMVADDQRAQFQIRETYLDFSAGDLDWRIGRQHVVWGEMVGLFFADVVSAKDLREFILPDFQILRIPQWAARAEYFKDDFHAEVVWIPFPSYDEIGKPQGPGSGRGADFYPYPLPMQALILDEQKPSTRFDHGNLGLRLSQLKNGWDVSGFYYTSMNSSPTFYQFIPGVMTPRHDRIWQLGGTLAKDLGDVVLKAEAVYTDGRRFNLTNVVAPDPSGGVVEQNTLDWAVGLDFNPTTDTRVNTQLFQRYFFDHDANIIPDRSESGVSLLVSHTFSGQWKAEALLVHSLNRRDWMFRPKAVWNFQPNWKMNLGLDVFGGPITGLFGQYDQRDRAYAEVRYDF